MNNKEKGFTLIELMVLIVIIGILCTTAFFRGAFINESIAIRAAEAQGYTNAVITERHWFFVSFRGCDDRDAAQFIVEAINPAKMPTEIMVCVGWPFKGATIRTR